MRLLRALFALLLIYPAAGFAQSTTITAASQYWGGSPLAQGKLFFFGVTPNGKPQSFSANGRLYPAPDIQHLQGGFFGNIVNGALSAALTVPDKAAATSSYPLCYDQQLLNTSTGTLVDFGTRCDVTGSTVSADVYVGPVVTPVYISGYSHGAAAGLPVHCAAGALYNADDTHAFYTCGSDAAFHQVSGSGSSITLKVGGTNMTGAMTTLNLVGSGGAVVTDSGSGTATIAADAAGAAATVAGNLTSEVTRATTAEGTNATAITTEATTARNATNLTSGTVAAARLPLGSSSQFGALKVDGTTITASAGVISAGASTSGTENKLLVAGTCSGGIAYNGAFALYDNNAPTPGCLAPATSTAASLAFAASPSSPQYAVYAASLPTTWTGSTLSFVWYSSATSGSVTWQVATACVAANGLAASPTYSSVQTVASTASSAAGGTVYTSAVSIATTGVNSCAGGEVMYVQVSRASSDTLAAPAYLLGIYLTTTRS